MIPFQYQQPSSFKDADATASDGDRMFIAGGTTMLDLMKLNVITPSVLVSIQPILDASVRRDGDTLVIGAGCTMSDLADHELVKDQFPVLRQALILAASPQIRNMATIGGNLLQRTRSTYYRHVDMVWPDQDPNHPVEGFGDNVDTSSMAVLGNRDSNDKGRLVAKYPGDFAVAVVAFDGRIRITGGEQTRTIPATEFYKTPTDGYQYETELRDGELITAVEIPIASSLQNSFYLKVRERSSYAFALASAAVGLTLDGNGPSATIRDAHVGMGGLASIPWRSEPAVSQLIGNRASDDVFQAAAEAALADARPPSGLEYKIPLAKRTIVRALRILRDQGPLTDAQLWAMQHGRDLSRKPA